MFLDMISFDYKSTKTLRNILCLLQLLELLKHKDNPIESLHFNIFHVKMFRMSAYNLQSFEKLNVSGGWA